MTFNGHNIIIIIRTIIENLNNRSYVYIYRAKKRSIAKYFLIKISISISITILYSTPTTSIFNFTLRQSLLFLFFFVSLFDNISPHASHASQASVANAAAAAAAAAATSKRANENAFLDENEAQNEEFF